MWKSKTGKPILDHELSFWMFKGNFLELKNKCSIGSQVMHIKMDMPGEGEDLNIDALRSFYNFLMSAATLVDHYRVFTQDEKVNQDFKDKYNQKISVVFHNDILAACVKKLRNFTTHRSLPACVVSCCGKPFDGYHLLIDINDLKDWKGWNQSEKQFLDSQEDTVSVIDLIVPYFNKTEEFYKWFMLEYVEYHPEEKGDIDLLFEKHDFQKSSKPPKRINEIC